MPEQAHEPIPNERRGCPDHDFVIQKIAQPLPGPEIWKVIGARTRLWVQMEKLDNYVVDVRVPKVTG